MKIGLAQINPCTGDLEGNVARCLAAVETAQAEGAALVVLPEMAIPGPAPRDILFDPSFVRAVAAATRDLADRVRDGPPVVVGSLLTSGDPPPNPHHPGLLNAAVMLEGGLVSPVATKRLLPTGDVSFEPRWFVPGPALPPVTMADRRIGFLVGDPPDLPDTRADLLVCIAASPFHRRVMAQRLSHARRQSCPVVYVNLCGGNDELIFDGQSFVVNKQGCVIARLTAFQEETHVLDLERETMTPASVEPLGELGEGASSPEEEAVYQALVLGVRDFARKNRLDHAFLGLSGGVDSAFVAVIAAEALGPERVTALAIPSRYTDPRSTDCARALAQGLGIHFEVVELETLHAAAECTLGPLLENDTNGTTAENVQARLRATVLMSFVNRYGGFLLNTSNKTESALGYGTLYGDLAGALCPIADLTKPQVYELAHWIQASRGVIPPYILERPPSAELRPGQVDPFDYDEIGPAMERLVQANRSDVALRKSEHKRWQMGVVLKVSVKAFGSGRMMPITRR